MTTVHTDKLYRVTSPQWRGREITTDDVLWMHSNRRSTLGGYIGRLTKTYPHRNDAGDVVGYSPTSNTPDFEIHLDLLEIVPSGGPLRFSGVPRPCSQQ